MSTCTHLAASALLGLTAVVAGGSAAQAGPQSVSVSSVAGVIFEDCHDHPISYAVAPPADANFWSIHLTVQGPDGTVADDFASVSSASGATSGVVMTRLCGSTSGAGVFIATGTYEYYQGRITPTERIPVTPVTFEMRLPVSAVEATPSDRTPRLGRRTSVTVKVTEEQPTGELRGTEGARVLLQRRTGRGWVKVRGAKGVTTGNGVAKVRFEQAWRGRTRLRAFANLGFPGRAASPSFVLRTRR